MRGYKKEMMREEERKGEGKMRGGNRKGKERREKREGMKQREAGEKVKLDRGWKRDEEKRKRERGNVLGGGRDMGEYVKKRRKKIQIYIRESLGEKTEESWRRGSKKEEER